MRRLRVVIDETDYYRRIGKYRERWNIYQRNHRRKRHKKFLEVIGDTCCICRSTNDQLKKIKRCIHIHEIYGLPHNPSAILQHPEDFVPLCPRCHRGTHFCMTYLGMTWKEIEKKIVDPT